MLPHPARVTATTAPPAISRTAFIRSPPPLTGRAPANVVGPSHTSWDPASCFHAGYVALRPDLGEPLEHGRMRVVEHDVERMRRRVGEAVACERYERAGERRARAGRLDREAVRFALVPSRPSVHRDSQRQLQRTG